MSQDVKFDTAFFYLAKKCNKMVLIRLKVRDVIEKKN